MKRFVELLATNASIAVCLSSLKETFGCSSFPANVVDKDLTIIKANEDSDFLDGYRVAYPAQFEPPIHGIHRFHNIVFETIFDIGIAKCRATLLFMPQSLFEARINLQYVRVEELRPDPLDAFISSFSLFADGPVESWELAILDASLNARKKVGEVWIELFASPDGHPDGCAARISMQELLWIETGNEKIK